jgi:hypothetical protein
MAAAMTPLRERADLCTAQILKEMQYVGIILKLNSLLRTKCTR